MFKACIPFVRGKSGDQLMWNLKLQSHVSGDFSMAVAQGNIGLEDQAQVYTSNAITIVGVYDGHGGSLTSRFVNDDLIRRLSTLASERGMSSATMLQAFSETEASFYQFVKQRAVVTTALKEVGTCCIVGVISNEMLYVANLGDSRAVLGRRIDSDRNRPLLAERLTTDHNVTDIEHKNQIVAEFHDIPDIVVFVNGSERIKGIIQVSRSIGDFYLKTNSMKRANMTLERPVLSPVPDVFERQITPQDLFVIFASDGFWELLSDQAAVDIVARNKRSGIAKRLLKAAGEAAAARSRMNYATLVTVPRGQRRQLHDDISVVVVYLDHQRKAGFTNATTRAPLDIFTHNLPNRR